MKSLNRIGIEHYCATAISVQNSFQLEIIPYPLTRFVLFWGFNNHLTFCILHVYGQSINSLMNYVDWFDVLHI